jgi:lipoyl(octanoyl) transferase
MKVRELGLLPYEDAWKLQLALIEERAADLIPDTLLVVEHPKVFTLGRKTPGVREEAALPKDLGGIPVFPVERGGEATYHGPGQLVMYPIFQLNLLKTGPRKFLRLMEDSIVETLNHFNLSSYWIEGKTGVWLKDKEGREKKIASLGIAVRRSVSYHGLALNVNNDLEPFRWISPCGFQPEVMTNLKNQLQREVSTSEVKEILAPIFLKGFERLKEEKV